MRLFAVDGDSPDAFFAANLTVLALPRFAVGNIDEVEAEVSATFDVLDGAELLGLDRVEVAGREALLIRYDLELLGLTGTGRQYWVLGLTRAYTITFSDLPEGGNAQTFDEIIATFTPLP